MICIHHIRAEGLHGVSYDAYYLGEPVSAFPAFTSITEFVSWHAIACPKSKLLNAGDEGYISAGRLSCSAYMVYRPTVLSYLHPDGGISRYAVFEKGHG